MNSFGVAFTKGRILTLISVGRPRMKPETAPEGSTVHREKVRHSCSLIEEGNLL